jgi:hypothetical protein
MEGSKSCLDELRNFFLAQDRGQRRYPFRIGNLGNAPTFFERLAVKELKAAKRTATLLGDNLRFSNSSA